MSTTLTRGYIGEAAMTVCNDSGRRVPIQRLTIRRVNAYAGLVMLRVLLLLLVIVGARPASAHPASSIHIQRVSIPVDAEEPKIAVDPIDGQHLAMIVTACTSGAVSCQVYGADFVPNLVLALSDDGGSHWVPHLLTRHGGVNPSVTYTSDGQLHASGLAFGGEGAGHNAVFVTGPGLTSKRWLTDRGPYDKPWLVAARHSATLYLTYTGPTSTSYGAMLRRSPNGGRTWSGPVAVSGNLHEPFANPAQAMPGRGEHLAVAWAYAPAGLYNPLHVRVMVSTSANAGRTFSKPRQVGLAWGDIIETTSYRGQYDIFYRTGAAQDERLVVTRSRNGGRSWATTAVSGRTRLYLDRGPAPGVDTAPDGRIDLVFYAARSACWSLNGARGTLPHSRRPPVDRCVYDVYYTSSSDGGATWTQPLRLNAHPVYGMRFTRDDGYSIPGDDAGMAATNRFAYPVWIQGAAVYTARIPSP